MDAVQLLNLPPRITEHSYSQRDVMLYALGIGAGNDPLDSPFVYEEALQTIPSMAVILGYPGFWQKEPEYGIDWRRNLHAEQSVLFHRDISVEGAVRSEMVIDAIADKGAEKGALLRTVRRIYDCADNGLLATVRQTSFLRGDGGCGSGGEELEALSTVPDFAPDLIVPFTIPDNLALIYRLSGDYNPLHADPEVAEAAGLPAPILHGLCTYGIVCHTILRERLSGAGMHLSRLDCRFTSVVFPGDTIQMDFWKVPTGGARFRVRVPDRDVIAVDRGLAEFSD